MTEEKVFSANEIAMEAKNTPGEVIEAFLAHIGNRKCEACGVNEWTFNQGTLLQFVNVGDIDKGMAVLCLLCNNCGNTRTFAWGRIRHFISHEHTKNVFS